jgi:hypothetical protein
LVPPIGSSYSGCQKLVEQLLIENDIRTIDLRGMNVARGAFAAGNILVLGASVH